MSACKGKRVGDGRPCKAPERLVNETGYCATHRPGGRERLAVAAKLGGHATARRFAAKGLTPDELGPLETHGDAKRWLETIARAVAVGRLTDRAATGAVRGLECWLKAHADEATARTINELEAQVRRLKADMGERGALPRQLRSLPPGRSLEVVE